ncbi:MAG: bifunctional metallophosphatase/5'-nucleotidase [Bacteroidaceae bacterium]|nr:bifunctional metallophosphatase/5'-nucleotidase [Bacteroidaceae bacterium]
MKVRYLFLFIYVSMLLSLCACTQADKQVVILFTNDTHSQIYPIAPDAKRNADMGGVERRKVLIDSLRGEHPHALLVDAGDVVQGTPYFNFYGGEVETMVLNELGYDVRTIGNHEYDNGGEALATMLRSYEGITVSSNYTFNRDDLRELIVPSWMCEAGGVKVGFVALNINPEGLLFPLHLQDINYHDPIAYGDSLALQLRQQGADVVVTLSHLGFTGEVVNENVIDSVLVQNTRYIDFVVGGHSHTALTEPQIFTNLDGRKVAVGQTGKSGVNLGYVQLTLEGNGSNDIAVDYRLLPVDARYDDRLDPDFAAKLMPYKNQVDSAMGVVLGHSAVDLIVDRPESTLSNWACDALADMARQRSGAKIDFAVGNTGGMRADIPKGVVTRGNVLQTFPFTNYMTIVKLKGSDVRDLFEQIAANGGEGVSREVQLVIKNGRVAQLAIGGNPVDDNRVYTIATINFVAEGGDGMVAFRKALSREDYPGFIFELYEDYLSRMTQQGLSIESVLDGRITIAQ